VAWETSEGDPPFPRPAFLHDLLTNWDALSWLSEQGGEAPEWINDPHEETGQVA
jgi:hypothetical protein